MSRTQRDNKRQQWTAYRSEARNMRIMVKRKIEEFWRIFVGVNGIEDPWRVTKIAKYLWKIKKQMKELWDEVGKGLKGVKEKAEALMSRNFITERELEEEEEVE